MVQPKRGRRVASRGKRPEGAVSTNGSNDSATTNGTNGRPWGRWAVGAAIPLSFAGFVLYWLRQRARADAARPDPYEEWWQARHKARENGNGSNGKRPETPRGRPEGTNPMFV